MPTRKLPQSDKGRLSAMGQITTKLGNLAEGETPPIGEANLTKLGTLEPKFKNLVQTRDSAFSAQTKATEAVEKARRELKMWVSHYLQNLNMAIDRGEDGFSASDRLHYGIDVSQEALPPLASQEDIIAAAESVIAGEAKRVEAGGVALTQPSAGNVSAKLDALVEKKAVQDTATATHSDEMDKVIAERPQVDPLIKDMWDEIEFSYRLDPAPMMRRKARQWGVYYATRPGETAEEEPALNGEGAEEEGVATREDAVVSADAEIFAP